MAPKGSSKEKGKATTKIPTLSINRQLSLDRVRIKGFISQHIRVLIRIYNFRGIKDDRAWDLFHDIIFLETVTTRHISQCQLMKISNDPNFRLKHLGVPHGSDGSDGTSYALTENYTLPVALATCRAAYVPPSLCGDVYASSERHVCYTLRRGCSYAEAVYTTPGD